MTIRCSGDAGPRSGRHLITERVTIRCTGDAGPRSGQHLITERVTIRCTGETGTRSRRHLITERVTIRCTGGAGPRRRRGVRDLLKHRADRYAEVAVARGDEPMTAARPCRATFTPASLVRG